MQESEPLGEALAALLKQLHELSEQAQVAYADLAHLRDKADKLSQQWSALHVPATAEKPGADSASSKSEAEKAP